MRKPTSFFLLCTLGFPLLHCGGDDAADQSTGPGVEPQCVAGPTPTSVAGFSRYTVDAALVGPAFVSSGDLNGDGKVDLVLSEFGEFETSPDLAEVTLSPGHVSVYYQREGLNCWEKVEIAGEKDELYFPNQTKLDDIDEDGDLDVAIPAGFFVCGFSSVGPCGAIAWFENTGNGFTRHDIVPGGDSRFYHEAIFVDFDGDGVKDLVTAGETASSAEGRWFKGEPSGDRFAKTPLVIGEGLGSFPRVLDVDKDGDLDVASAEFFVKDGAFAWLERTAEPTVEAPAGVFTRHIINSDVGRSIMLRFVPDLYGDGVLRAVGTNHTNSSRTPPDPESGVFVFDIPTQPTELWPKKLISEGIESRPSVGAKFQAAPGIFGAGDLDDDGDIDLAVSGDGDARTFWLEQTAPGAFETHILEEKLGQAGGTLILDLDADGKNEVVFTGYEDSVLYIYQQSAQ
jgi:FG-GAP-like repeat